MKIKNLITYCGIIFTLFSYGQSDECATATNIPNVTSYCSVGQEFSNETSTASTFGLPTCWAASASFDVWFRFTAEATDVNISAEGTGFSGITRPRIALYSGDCAVTIFDEACANGTSGVDLTTLYNGGLVIGQEYLIRISSTSGGVGTFDLCVDNFTPPPAGSADCSGAIYLCDKSSFGVSGFSGGGLNSSEPNTTSCMTGGEQNSIWFYWTCQTSGTLTFDITPNDNSHDVDWALYQLTTNNACVRAGNAVRCNVASCLNATGSTGLNLTDTDVSETPGCDATKNAYCRFFNMVAGTSYAILINNDTGFDGVNMSFGGTGTFTGTTPSFNAVAAICEGEALAALPTTSTNGITGAWSPALNNTATTTYTFTPDAGQCASPVTLQITVNQKVTPTFTAVSAICEGEVLAALPTTSLNSFDGNWSPALNNTATTTYTFTPSAGECANTTTLDITVNQKVNPTFNAVAAICEGEVLAALPTTSLNSFDGTWSPALNNTATTTYTFTPAAGECANTTTLDITVNQKVDPTFNAVAAICEGEVLAALPTTSLNSFDGTWSPALNNTATTTYTFTPALGECANSTTLDIVVNQKVNPTFNAVADICEGDALAALPTTSLNSFDGTWTPTLNNTTTTTYTFTPDVGECANSTTLDIEVNQKVIPTFNAIADICEGDALAALPTTSLNTFDGTWSPALDNTTTTTYTFNPAIGECATNTTLDIIVNSRVSPNITCGLSTSNSVIFNWNLLAGANDYDISYSINSNPAIINGNQAANSFTLGGLSPNDQVEIFVQVNGTDCYEIGSGICSAIECVPPIIVSDATSDIQCEGNAVTFSITETGGTSYQWQMSTDGGATFNDLADGGVYSGTSTLDLTISDNTGLDANQYQLVIDEATNLCPTTSIPVLLTVNARVLPTFTAVNPICDGEVLNALPLISNNSINGTWLPALDNTTTTTYTFTPDAGECALDNTLQIVVNPIITPTFNAVAAICNGDVLAALPLSSTNNIDGTWSPALDNTLTTTYTFTPDAGQCAVTSDLTIDVVDYQTPVITCGTSTVSSVTFDWTALVGASDYDISYSINNGAAINGGNQAGVSFTLNGLNPDDVVDLTLTTNGTDCYNIGTATCTASTCNSPIITAQPTSQTDCEGNQVNFTVSATGATAFQWQVSNNNGTTFFNVIDFPGNISGATTNALSITDNTGLDGLIYQVVISEVDNTCPTISNQVSLTVNPIPVINATNNGPLCEDANLNLNVNNVAGAVFSWTGPNYASGAQNNVIPLALIANSGDYTVTATANGCSASSTTTVTVSGETPINIVAAGPFCETDIPVVLVADVPGGIWTGSGIIDDAAGVFDPSQATIGANDITYTLLTGCGGQNTTTITVNAQANASFLLENNILDPINPQAEIINLSQNAVTYEWTFGDNTTSTDVEPIHLFSQEPRNYTINLIATSIDGCSDTTSIIVTVPETLIFYVPNSFTPNGDELNNTFLPIFTSGFDPFDYRLSIYNRWGELIFESLDHTVGWDGTFKNLGISEQGTYTFKIEFALKSTGDKETSVGSFSLFR